MSLVTCIKRLFKPSYEVPATEYYSSYLKPEDSEALNTFLAELTAALPVPCAVLAVGSSTFPKRHWEYMKEIKARSPGITGLDSYKDVDLLIVPKAAEKLDLADITAQTLALLGYDCRIHKGSTTGISYYKQADGSFLPFLHIDYGLKSVSTKLRNGLPLDLILGREEDAGTPAQQKIADERKKGNAFSLLYA